MLEHNSLNFTMLERNSLNSLLDQARDVLRQMMNEYAFTERIKLQTHKLAMISKK